ncbi:GAF domain-containing protein [Listeria sp. FSL L7-1509]|uniref:GAF domain-containing protein n=1 Tax=Listeria immobilis TaxID=2713502 RepID=A0ABR6STU5_9LIST|nr:GAF domain-containing protein [Listeria immobilis]MBC1482142.1 GAF domain-containing protein [Listeria immobilis]MBC1505533.1 GAF domain-containing protein [Listeria immobilis]MBC1509034.1 GAF domain-containing protein [Listeria immobilis]MBC6303842.1 GAF domain-containing protein [Listeria immobilis]MBC6312355.1 GAF domain-containing protein [Listeria immobilis]
MRQIQSLIEQKQKEWQVDFVGLAENVAPTHAPKEIHWLYVAGNQSIAYKNIRLQVGRGIAGLVWKTARSQKDKHILADVEKRLEYPIARTEKLVNVYAVPVMDKHEVIGVLLIGYRSAIDVFDEQKIEKFALELSSLILRNE